MNMKTFIKQDSCLSRRYKGHTCSACVDSCPCGAITDSLNISASCRDCGICLTTCPSDAYRSECYTEEAVEELIAQDGSIYLTCQRCDSNSQWPCLGFLDPALLMTFLCSRGNLSYRTVVIYLNECEKCCQTVARHLQQVVKETQVLLAPQQNLILAATNKIPSQQRMISRRQFFDKLWGASVKTLRNTAFPETGLPEALPRRKLFIRYAAPRLASLPKGQSTFYSITITQKCSACRLCSQVCPTGAIKTKISGTGAVEFIHNPLVCRQCKLCVSHCPQDALSFTAAYSLSERLAARVKLPVCPSCGSAFQPIGRETLCIECIQKKKNDILF